MTKFRVKHGGKVSVGIGGPPEPDVRKEATGSRFVGTENEHEQLYVFRRPGITLFDLGTRRNPDDSYRHVAFADVVVVAGVDPAEGWRTSYHDALITANFTESLRLPQSSEYLYVDLVFGQPGQTGIRILAGNGDKRFYVKDAPLEAEPDPALITDTGWNNGSARFSGPGHWSVAAETGFFYNAFDTSDTAHFKVTPTSDYTAEAVPFSLSSADKPKIYLTPRLYVNVRGAGTGENPFVHYLGRLPVVPDFVAIKAPIFTRVFRNTPAEDPDGHYIEGRVTDAYFDTINEYLLTLAPEHFTGWSATNDDGNAFEMSAAIGNGANPTLPPGIPILVAIVDKAGSLFYVWRIGNYLTDTLQWHNSQLTHL